jgi:hypothetical protein
MQNHCSHVAAYYYNRWYYGFATYFNMAIGYIAYPVNNAKVI